MSVVNPAETKIGDFSDLASFSFFLSFFGLVDWVHWVHGPLIGSLHYPRIRDEYGEFGGMRIGKENLSTRRKPFPVLLCPPQITHDDLGSNPGGRGGKPPMARPFHIYTSLHISLPLTGLLSAYPGKWWNKNSKNLEVNFPCTYVDLPCHEHV
jgi:hypothetical protein